MCVHDLSQFCAVAVYTMSDGIASRAFRYSVNMVLVGVQEKLTAHVPRMRKSNLEIRIVGSSGRPQWCLFPMMKVDFSNSSVPVVKIFLPDSNKYIFTTA